MSQENDAGPHDAGGKGNEILRPAVPPESQRFLAAPFPRWVFVLAVVALLAWPMYNWTINRVYVPVGKSLLLRYKGPLLAGSRTEAAPGELARIDAKGNLEVGVLEQMLGPGRHFYSRIWWEYTLVDDVIVVPGELAVITSKVGKTTPGGGDAGAAAADAAQTENQFLVEGELGHTHQRGILRKVFGPGRYRVNPYAYEVRKIKSEVEGNANQQKHSGWVDIPTGFVGVVTNQTDNPITKAKRGIQKTVLPAGIYPINPREQTVDIVEIGYREKSISSTIQVDAQGNAVLDSSGEPVMVPNETGITFPSKDGFTIHMDFTAIWGVMPEQAPRVIESLGNIQAVETRVIVPLIESICRNEGSRLGAVELLVGETREQFQDETSRQFEEKLKTTGVTMEYGLVRHIYIPQEVRVPIQLKALSDELKLTRDQEQLTAKTEANLREAEKKVELETERTRVETEKMVAKQQAEGDKLAAETRAETTKMVAEVDRKTAELESQAVVTLGQADADAQRLLETAKAEKFKLAVAAFGGGEAYNQWVFATGLPADIKLQFLYAGSGTFWTDLKGFTDAMLGKQMQESRPKASP